MGPYSPSDPIRPVPAPRNRLRECAGPEEPGQEERLADRSLKMLIVCAPLHTCTSCKRVLNTLAWCSRSAGRTDLTEHERVNWALHQWQLATFGPSMRSGLDLPEPDFGVPLMPGLNNEQEGEKEMRDRMIGTLDSLGG